MFAEDDKKKEKKEIIANKVKSGNRIFILQIGLLLLLELYLLRKRQRARESFNEFECTGGGWSRTLIRHKHRHIFSPTMCHHWFTLIECESELFTARLMNSAFNHEYSIWFSRLLLWMKCTLLMYDVIRSKSQRILVYSKTEDD